MVTLAELKAAGAGVPIWLMATGHEVVLAGWDAPGEQLGTVYVREKGPRESTHPEAVHPDHVSLRPPVVMTADLSTGALDVGAAMEFPSLASTEDRNVIEALGENYGFFPPDPPTPVEQLTIPELQQVMDKLGVRIAQRLARGPHILGDEELTGEDALLEVAVEAVFKAARLRHPEEPEDPA